MKVYQKLCCELCLFIFWYPVFLFSPTPASSYSYPPVWNSSIHSNHPLVYMLNFSYLSQFPVSNHVIHPPTWDCVLILVTQTHLLGLLHIFSHPPIGDSPIYACQSPSYDIYALCTFQPTTYSGPFTYSSHPPIWLSPHILETIPTFQFFALFFGPTMSLNHQTLKDPPYFNSTHPIIMKPFHKKI